MVIEKSQTTKGRSKERIRNINQDKKLFTSVLSEGGHTARNETVSTQRNVEISKIEPLQKSIQQSTKHTGFAQK